MADCYACNAATCILFGDGTGAMVLTAQQGQCSLLGLDAHSDGGGQKHLNVSLLTSVPESQSRCRLHEVAGHQSQLSTCSLSADDFDTRDRCFSPSCPAFCLLSHIT